MGRVTWPGIRDAVVLLAGLGLLGHETIVAAEPRTLLVTVAAAAIGLPATLIADRRFVRSGPTSSSPTPIQRDEAGTG